MTERRLNIIYCVFFHKFILAFTVRNYYLASKQRCILLISPSMMGLADSYGLTRGEDYVVSLEEISFSGALAVNVVVHHYKNQIEAVSDICENLQGKVRGLGVSFFADGYLNTFLTQDDFRRFLDGRPDLERNELLSFGVEKETEVHTGFTCVIIPSETFIYSVSSNRLVGSVDSCLKDADPSIAKADVALVAFRPWETRIKEPSASDQGGDHYRELMLDFIVKETRNISHIIFHGDNRAQRESRVFFDYLKSNVKDKIIVDSTRILPGNVNMDIIVLVVSKLWHTASLRVLAFDSTLCLPFVDAGFRGDFVMGVTGDVLERYVGLDALKLQLKRRYRYLEEFVGLSSRAFAADKEADRYVVLRGQ